MSQNDFVLCVLFNCYVENCVMRNLKIAAKFEDCKFEGISQVVLDVNKYKNQV